MSSGTNTPVYSVSISALPAALALPGNLPLTQPNIQTLQFVGAMTSPAQATLSKLDPSDTTFAAAIGDLYAQPRAFLALTLIPALDGFLDLANAITTLIEMPWLTTQTKGELLLKAVLAELQQTASYNLILQTLGAALALDMQTLGWLLQEIMPAFAPASPGKMIGDFMALASAGFSGSYFASQNPTGTPALQRTDGAINFQWGSQTPDPGIPSPAFSADWTGSVVVPITDSYTFHVQADPASTVQLLVNGVQVSLRTPATASPTDRFTSPMPLTQAQNCAVELQYSYPGPGSSPTSTPAQVSLNWSSPSMPENLLCPAISVAVQDLQLLYRLALLLTTLNTGALDVKYLQQHGSDFAGRDLNGGGATVPFDVRTLPSQAANYISPWFDQWKRLNALFALKVGLPAGNVGIFKIFATASQQGVDFYKSLSPIIVAATGWNADQIQYLYTEFGLSPPDFVNEKPMLLLQKCLALSTKLGVSCVQLFEWATILPDTPQSYDIKNAVKAKYNAAAWTNVGEPLANKLRYKQRNALMAYVLALPMIQAANITDANGLYEYFLIDVQMAPCMLTSRIVQASAAVQLFVQRCLMNLEGQVSPTQIDATQWDWMQNYRVWQANRLVFLYPENYLVPSLRDDMTPPFQDLKNALLQTPVTDDNVTQAYADFLNTLNEVAQLEIAGMYWQQETPTELAVGGATGADNSNSGLISTLHVFGRTPKADDNHLELGRRP
jgi:hypothetical protein